MTGGFGPVSVAHPRLAALGVVGGALLVLAAGLTVAAPAVGVDAGRASHRIGAVGYLLVVAGGGAYVAATVVDSRRRE